jgi:amino acid adenylation domain-containing protein
MPNTLMELLQWRAQEDSSSGSGYVYLDDKNGEEKKITYAELDRRARAVACRLREASAAGERALLLYPPGLDFLVGFFGCMYAGIVAVPAYPPSPARRNRSLPRLDRLQTIITDAQATVALTTSPVMSLIETLFVHSPSLKKLNWFATDAISAEGDDDWSPADMRADSLAFIQYTSGSTGTPRGVMLTHANLLHNARTVCRALEHTSQDLYVSWLPTFHDMGFMAGVLQPALAGISVILMSPLSFLQRPVRWLEAISRFKGTTSGGPNFAYDLCVRKVTDEERARLDLTSWSVAFNGAESIRSETLERFAAAFEPCGFRREALYPCYGLAEATLIVTGGQRDRSFVTKTVKAASLEDGRIETASADDESCRTLVSCGRVLGDQRVVIADPQSLKACGPNQVGEICVAGPSVAQGYWNNPEKTEETFGAHLGGDAGGPFLRTGDLGFLSDGELYVTGRIKDLIIVRGRNHYPQDIELTVEQCHAALRPGCGAAFSVTVSGEEQLVVVYEVDTHQPFDLETVVNLIREEIADEHDLQLYALVLIKPRGIPKTSSGKIQRHACRAMFLEKRFDTVFEWRLSLTGDSTPVTTALTAEAVESWLVAQLAAKVGRQKSDINPSESILRYGLDSLTAAELTQTFEEHLGVSLPIVELLQGLTIKELASRAAARVPVQTAPTAMEIVVHGSMTEYPLSYGQRALWFLYKLAPESTAYNIVRALSVNSELDVPALKRAFDALLDRHPVLRSNFDAPQGEPRQKISRNVEAGFHVEDAVSWTESELNERLIEEAHRPFRLEQGPLINVRLFTRSSQNYILLFSIHHIISDLWSLAILVHELGVLYEAEAGGGQLQLPAIAPQYSDFVRWQAEMLSSQEGERLWQYWKQKLSGELPVLELPTDRPRSPLQTYRGASLPFSLGETLTLKLKELAQQNDVTLYMLLLTVFEALLFRYTAQEEIIIGSVATGRNRPEWKAVVGYFVNPTVLRVNLSGETTFRALLQRVKSTVIDAFAFQDYPYDLLVKRLQPVRDASRQPLFQVMFILQKAHLLNDEGLASLALNEAGARVRLGKLALESIAIEQQSTQFDLTLTMAETGGCLGGSFQYNTDLFDPATISRMASHFQILSEAVAADADKPISDLPLLSEAERKQILLEWNDTGEAYPTELCLQELFEQQVKRTPDRVALVFEEQQLSYAELNRRANQLAHSLRQWGVGAETKVGVMMERSAEMVIALLGILKAGGAYVPLDPAYPRERLSFMLADADVAVLLTQQRLRAALPESQAKVICLDTDWSETIEGHRSENPFTQTAAHHPAYVIYTSGSTGQPKGVINTHYGICNRLLWMQQTYRLTETDCVLQKTPFSFDVSVWEFFWPLMTGARLVMARPGGHQDSAYLVRLISEQRVTTLHFVPSMLQVFLEEEGLDQCHSLRRVICSGEALSHALQERFFEQLEAELHNLYGPTEAAVDVTYWICERDGERRVVPIGRPIANTQTYVLDERMQVVPAGVAGELYLAGAGLARGYLKRADLTAEKFIPNPFSAEAGARMYRTGDLARHLPDGNIEYLGRMDYQVKVRGFRIELGEIEQVLAAHPCVRDALVMAREEVPGDKRLVAYVVAAPGAEGVTGRELSRYLGERLPDYMVPRHMVLMERMPLTANGKIDRRALPPPEHSGSDLDEEYVEPRTPTEELLAGVFAQLLGIERVGVHDSFFNLGGHSLLATQLISRVREIFKVEVPLRNLFEIPTVRALAERIERAMKEGHATVVPAIERVRREQPLPLSYAQQRLWFLDQLEPHSSTYNIPGALRLMGRLNIAALEQSLNEVVRRHEALRTTFALFDEQPVQVITDAQPLKLEIVELQGLANSEREAKTSHLTTEEARRPFDLQRGPLLRTRLLRLGEEEHVLLCTMHHIGSDGWSLGVFFREVAALYEAYCLGAASPLSELGVQYADYAVWQREWLQGEVLEEQLSYWREQLRDAPALELPVDRPRPAVLKSRAAVRSFVLEKRVADALKALSQAENVTLFMTLLAAWQILLSNYSGQEDVVVGTPIANRTHSQTEELIGFFVNTLVLRTDLSGEPTFRELVRRVREICLAAYAHQEVPFERVVEELQPTRDMSRTPLFQVMFALQNMPQEELALPGLGLKVMGTQGETVKFDLSLALADGEQGLSGLLEFNTELFDAATIEGLVQHFKNLLESIITNPDRKLSALPLLTEAQWQQLVIGWNETQADYPAELCIHELFEAQVERTPDSVAVIFDNQQMTYLELNRRANQLARYLRDKGVGPETRVGIHMERSPEMMIGLLGIFKAGAAYLPLDPDYPRERLSFMLADAAVPMLLTQQRLTEQLPLHQAEVICLDTDWPEIAGESTKNLKSGAGPYNLAYVIYTSGSTGMPKGVMIPHRGLVNYLAWCVNAYRLTDGCGSLAHSSIGADLSITSLFSPLLAGRSVMLLPEDEILVSLAAALRERYDFSFVKLTPSHVEALSQLLPAGQVDGQTKALIIGGEALWGETLSLWRDHAPATRIINEYGPTETVVGCCVYETAAGATLPGAVPIGRPIANTQIYLLDQHLRPVPSGVRGEIYIAGDGLARGYLNRPDVTAERFIANPFGAGAGERLYKTGDLARLLPSGEMEYLGRMDYQVKVRGFRIELGEIEQVLAAHPCVRDALVMAREDSGGEKQLAAYVVVEQGEETVTAGQLVRYLGERLPDYMVPRHMVLMGRIPLTANGKVDRLALPTPDNNWLDSERQYVAPRNSIEEVVAGIWKQVLQRERVGIHDNFFELGGHSLLATRVMHRVQETLQVELSLRAFFEAPTVAHLAEDIRETGRASHKDVEKIAQIWLRIQQLSPHEIKQMLSGATLI